MQKLYFITHPEVVIDPEVPATQWPLSVQGKERMRQLSKQPWMQNIGAIYSSCEQKSIDGAAILADGLKLSFTKLEALGEIDRSATGYLPFDEFMNVYAEFLANPTVSVRGWEISVNAQQRIINAIQAVVEETKVNYVTINDNHSIRGDIAIISHGVVGLLYLCHIKGCPVSKEQEHPAAANGGNYFCVDVENQVLINDWMPIDSN